MSTIYSVVGSVLSVSHLNGVFTVYVLPETMKSIIIIIKKKIQAPKIARLMRIGFSKLGNSKPETHSETIRIIYLSILTRLGLYPVPNPHLFSSIP